MQVAFRSMFRSMFRSILGRSPVFQVAFRSLSGFSGRLQVDSQVDSIQVGNPGGKSRCENQVGNPGRFAGRLPGRFQVDFQVDFRNFGLRAISHWVSLIFVSLRQLEIRPGDTAY